MSLPVKKLSPQVETFSPTETFDNSNTSSIFNFINSSKFHSIAEKALLMFCFSLPLSIGLSQFFGAIIILQWLLSLYYLTDRSAFYHNRFSKTLTSVSSPVIAWVLISAITSLTGINVTHALIEVTKTSFYLLLIFAIPFSLAVIQETPQNNLNKRVTNCLIFLIIGQSTAALHSVLSTALQYKIPLGVPGPVTESGQLVLVISAAIGLYFLQPVIAQAPIKVGRYLLNAKVFLALSFTALLLLAWPRLINLQANEQITLFIQLCSLLVFLTLLLTPLLSKPVNKSYLLWICAALLFATLIINLKRGPWLGVFVALSMIGILHNKRLVYVTVTAAFICLTCLSPARSRALDSYGDFSISGGRKNMWQIGSELVQRFPLGIGPDNSSVMRKLDPTLPELHRHMHNNFLNILVETGSLGLFVYLWWIWAIIRVGLNAWKKSIRVGVCSLCLSTAIIGWQTAGLVEFNFGDGEVRLMAFLIMGLILSLATLVEDNQQTIN